MTGIRYFLRQSTKEGLTSCLPEGLRAVFSVSHNRFGISYSDISRHCNISDRNIIRSVKAYKDIPDCDGDVKRLNELIEVELSKFPIV